MRIHTKDGRCIVVDVKAVFALWADPTLGTTQIAAMLGLTKNQMWNVSQRLKLPRRPRAEMERLAAPTEEQIAERCAEVRAGWTDAEREKRCVGRGQRPWRLPSYAYDGRAVMFQPAEREF
jgi:hypothetical protein